MVIAAMPLAKSDAVLAALERGQASLDLAHGGVPVAAVLLAIGIGVLALEVALELGRVGEGVRRRLHDRQRERVGSVSVGGSGVNGVGPVGQRSLNSFHVREPPGGVLARGRELNHVAGARAAQSTPRPAA